jgi:hypothetical protein
MHCNHGRNHRTTPPDKIHNILSFSKEFEFTFYFNGLRADSDLFMGHPLRGTPKRAQLIRATPRRKYFWIAVRNRQKIAPGAVCVADVAATSVEGRRAFLGKQLDSETAAVSRLSFLGDQGSARELFYAIVCPLNGAWKFRLIAT